MFRCRPNLSLIAASLMVASCAPAGAADPLVAPTLITRVDQLAGPLKSKTREVFQAKLTGVVYGIDRVHSSLILADDSGWLWLEAENIPDTVGSGAQVTAQGTLAVGNGHAFLGKTTIVEGDGYNDVTRQSGRVYLGAGQHALKLLYHQSTRKALLTVEYEGPGVSRRRISSPALWHADTNVPGNYLPGLECECFRGITVEKTDLRMRTPDYSNVVGSFTSKLIGPGKDPKTSSPTVNYALRYSGSLQIEQPGIYQFYILANDGASLTLDYDSQCQFEVLGHTNLAAPALLIPAQTWGNLAEPLWAQFEGQVNHVGGMNGQLLLGLNGDSGSLEVVVSEGDVKAASMLLNNYIRVEGLASGVTGFHGQKNAGKILVPSMSEVAIVSAAEGNWQIYPGLTIEPLVGGSTNLDQTPVEIQGKVAEVNPGNSLTIQDGTGQIKILTSLAQAGDKGAGIEALGLPWHTRQGTFLRYSVYRTLSETNADQPLPRLTSIEQIRRLKDKDFGIPYPFTFKGTVIDVKSGGVRGTVRGEAEGIAISTTNEQPAALQLGTLCEFEGTIQWRHIQPEAIYSRFRVIGQGQWPEPQHPTWAELMNGSVESQWVEVQGVVIEVQPSSGFLTIKMPGGDIQMHFSQSDPDVYSRCINSVVRVRGIAYAFFNKANQVDGAAIEVNSLSDVTVIRSAPRNLFSLPIRRVTEVLAFDPDAATLPFVKVSGQIIFIRGQTYYLLDGTNGLHFTATRKADLAVGDIVEVVGIPENDRLSSHLRNCNVKKLRHAALPQALLVQPEKINSEIHESTLIQIDAKLLSVSTNFMEQLLELQLSPHRIALARLDDRKGQFPRLLPQSRVRVTGVFTGTVKKDDGPPEILLNSPADVVVLETPPWWNVQRSLTLLGTVTLALVGAITWITALRRRVDRRTQELSDEINGHKDTEASLHEKTALLQNEIEERKRIQLEVETIHRQLMDTSRQAGQAEIAANIIHNVGNVLNSVNVSASVITDRIRRLHISNLARVADVLEQPAANSAAGDEKRRQAPQFLREISIHLVREQEGLLAELHNLGQNVEHINEIIATQQAYAKRLGIYEKCPVADIIESALKVSAAAYARQAINIVRHYEPVPEAILDKHRVLQILVNLFQNSKYACETGGQNEKNVTIRIQHCPPDDFCIQVVDNGIGITLENLPHIFNHGFTTRPNGHGFGLHSAALGAKEMGGSLAAHSDGPGTGATFTLQLPLRPPPDALLEQPTASNVTINGHSQIVSTQEPVRS